MSTSVLRRGTGYRTLLAWPAWSAVLALLAVMLLQPGPAQSQAAPASSAAAPAAVFDLITPAEAEQNARAEAAAGAEIRTRQIPGLGRPAPGIQVLSPVQAATPVAAPLRIEVAFTAQPGTRIVPSSFRVLYGLLKIDLTERLRQHATINEKGAVVDRANVPNGQHRLFLQVADDKGNTAEQELRIRVGAPS